jgi:hypothetical protein
METRANSADEFSAIPPSLGPFLDSLATCGGQAHKEARCSFLRSQTLTICVRHVLFEGMQWVAFVTAVRRCKRFKL